jgi:hypothetical protein
LTEAEWLECQKPTNRLYSFLQGATERKRLLFACACFRQGWHLIRYRSTMEAVETIERYADGAASKEQLLGAAREAEMAANLVPWRHQGHGTLTDPSEVADFWRPQGPSPGWQLEWAVARVANTQQFNDISYQVFWEHGTPKTSMFFQDIFGHHRDDMTHRPFTKNPLCCHLAEAAYAECMFPSGELDFGRLGVLGDAIEELGGYGPILDHLRQPSPHVRGCWAIDALTGRIQ